jgi:hypothetical protein
MDSGTIIAGFIISTVGFSFFLYGKKQARIPQLLVGILLMVAPFLVRDPLWMSVSAVLLLVGLCVALRYQ